MSAEVEDSWLASVLSESGWSPSRKVDVSGAIAAWSSDGHVLSEAAIDLVSRLDGTGFEYPRLIRVNGFDSCSFDAKDASRSIYPEVVRDYERFVEFPLCPIGVSASRHIVLLVSGGGAIYGGYDRFLACCGEGWKQAVWNIYHRIGARL
ncbi:SUKH-3 domain-containing protein [Embleya sp. AB8]|uniref:SUKH-3 domain-containing protein n=1 Tax=Embleya sp. AB8 TaxID=3156304 RepID=UPI003C76B44D